MRTPSFWQSKNPVSTLLLPLSWLYGLGVKLRQQCACPAEVPAPILCIGNVTAGGGGKTPVALHIGALLKQKNIRAFFLSRGYGGKLSGPVRVDTRIHGAQEVGDEPLLLAEVLPTVVAKDRLKGAKFAVAQGAQIIVMDDGFQNFSLKKNLSLLVIDGAYGFGNDRLLPAGPLRESPEAALARADAAIVINGQISLPENLPVISAHTRLQGDALRGKKLFAFCGLARPQKFFAALEAAGALLAGTASFPDHHLYRESELKALAGKAAQLQATLATTAKDAVRLPPAFRKNILVIPMMLVFDNPDQLSALLESALHARN